MDAAVIVSPVHTRMSTPGLPEEVGLVGLGSGKYKEMGSVKWVGRVRVK